MPENQDDKIIKEDWVIKFLNLPHPDQIEFLYRYSLEDQLRKEIENKVFGE